MSNFFKSLTGGSIAQDKVKGYDEEDQRAREDRQKAIRAAQAGIAGTLLTRRPNETATSASNAGAMNQPVSSVPDKTYAEKQYQSAIAKDQADRIKANPKLRNRSTLG